MSRKNVPFATLVRRADKALGKKRPDGARPSRHATENACDKARNVAMDLMVSSDKDDHVIGNALMSTAVGYAMASCPMIIGSAPKDAVRKLRGEAMALARSEDVKDHEKAWLIMNTALGLAIGCGLLPLTAMNDIAR